MGMNILKMKKYSVLIVLMLLVFRIETVKAELLSPSAEFSLITISPGNELYSCFGHSAILLQDSTNKLFKIYNYGTFDFGDPDFYVNFVRGKLKYKLEVENPGDLIFMAREENRAAFQQIFNLTQGQKQRLYDFLERNYLPENRFYKYDFFYDNCSSRIRDALVYACGDSLNFNLKPATEEKSFRSLIDPYLENKRYQDLGMDLGLGVRADKIATPYQYMFLPDYLMNGFAGATIKMNGKNEKLVIFQQKVLPNEPDTSITPFYFKPWFALWAFFLLVLGITYYQFKHQRNGRWLDTVLFTFTGLFGLLILFLWFFTDHGVTVKNYNLIWAMPLHLIFIPMLVLKKNLKLVSSYFLANFFVIFFLLIFWRFIPQELNAYTIPFLMTLGLRSMYIYYRIDKDFVRWQQA
jgi:hypothetical protein